MCSMVLEYLPTFARTTSPSHVGKYTMHGAYGNGCLGLGPGATPNISS